MAGGMRKVGDWAKVKRLISALGPEMEKAHDEWLAKIALKAEAIAVTHISTQDLRWTPLKPATIAAKVRAGQSENIYVATSTYFQSITSHVKGDKAFAGVKRDVTHDDGTPVADIAKMMEFGTRSMPPRPLWEPTFKETIKWGGIRGKGSIVHILRRRFAKY